jgi:hypothetical protein
MTKTRRLKQNIHNKKRITKRKRADTFSKMNCSPAVKGKASIRDSCLTPDVLIQLKQYYNSSHPSQPIKYNAPAKIWGSLRRKLNKCDKEDCWLDLIHDASVRKSMDKEIFAPDQPSSWKKNPNTWLTNYDIYDVLRQYENKYPQFCVIRPSAIDFDDKIGGTQSNMCVTEDLCTFDLIQHINEGKTKFGIVFNLDKHDQPGSHWVSLFIDIDDEYVFYMDSVGDPVPHEIQVFVDRVIKQGLQSNKHMNFYENSPMQHQTGDTECGVYSLYFIITMLTGQTDKLTFDTVDDKISFFKNQRIPDKYISKFRKIYFNT